MAKSKCKIVATVIFTGYPAMEGLTLPEPVNRQGLGRRISHQEFRRLGTLLDQFFVFHFQAALDAAHITRNGDALVIELDGFDQVISQVHHKFHTNQNSVYKKSRCPWSLQYQELPFFIE